MSHGLTEWGYEEIKAECERAKMSEEKAAAKIRTIWLSKDPSEADFLVEKVQDSVDYLPGTYVPEPRVQNLCDNPLWKVIVTKFKK